MAVGLEVICMDNVSQIEQGNEQMATCFTLGNPITKLKDGSFLAKPSGKYYLLL